MRSPHFHSPIWKFARSGTLRVNTHARGRLYFHHGLLALLFLPAACSVKQTVKTPVAPRKAAARHATLDELLARLDTYQRRLQSLSSANVRLSFASGKVESGKLEQYRSAPGYILLKRPDALRLTIQNPVTKTSIAELASRGDTFSFWLPRDNKLFVGRNRARELELEGGPSFTARPIHIFEAIVFEGVQERPGLRVALEEDSDAEAKYYVVGVFQDLGTTRLRSLRRIWFERSEMNLSRQETFAADGSVSSIVTYSNYSEVDGVALPLAIKIDRPADGYTLEMQFRSWRVNPEIEDTAFVLTPPPTAQRIELKEKAE